MVGSYYIKQKALTSFSAASARRTEHEIPKLRKRSRCTKYYMRTFAPFLALLLLSCKSLNNKPQKSFIVYSKDSIETKSNLKFLENICSELNIPLLKDGVDSFELRIWNSGNGYAGDKEQILCIFKFTKGDFIATKTIFETREAKSEEKAKYLDFSFRVIDSSKSYRLKPLISTKVFLDSVMNYDLLHIPFQNEIPNFYDNLTHGSSFTFEISTKDYYKVFTYHSPEYYSIKRHELNNQKIKSFIEFIETSFNLNFHWYPEWYN